MVGKQFLGVSFYIVIYVYTKECLREQNLFLTLLGQIRFFETGLKLDYNKYVRFEREKIDFDHFNNLCDLSIDWNVWTV